MIWSLFKRRDERIYPRDEFGDELFRAFPDPKRIPLEASLWFDMYFRTEADADRVSDDLERHHLDVERDFDDESEEGDELGPWNLDTEKRINPSHGEIAYQVRHMRDLVERNNGRLASFVLTPWDGEDDGP